MRRLDTDVRNAGRDQRPAGNDHIVWIPSGRPHDLSIVENRNAAFRLDCRTP